MASEGEARRHFRGKSPVLVTALGLLIAISTVPLACGPSFTSCEAHRSCPTGKGGAGGAGPAEPADGGAGGVPGGGAFGGTETTGAAGNGGADDAATGGAAGDAGGPSATGGASTTGPGEAGGSGGVAGSDGQGGADACSASPCGPGTCMVHVDSFLCDCPTTHIGAHCEVPRFEPLGFLVGDTDSFALDVSGDGRVVVGRSGVQVQANWFETPFYWTHETGMRPLVSFAGRATATNSDGSVVVGTHAEGKAFRWIAGKGVTDLGAPTGGTSAAIDTSEDGAVVVGTSTVPPAGASAFRWTAAGGLVPIDSTVTSVTGVSRDGLIIVGSRRLAAGEMAFRWSASGGFIDFAAAGATYAPVAAMTSDGAVAWGVGLFSGARQVFRWSTEQTSAASFLRIPTTIADAEHFVEVSAASDNPARVACYLRVAREIITSENQQEKLGSACFGFQLPASAPKDSPTVLEVATTLENLGVELDGWKLTRTTSISFDGTVLVGNGIDPEGKSQAWIARLP